MWQKKYKGLAGQLGLVHPSNLGMQAPAVGTSPGAMAQDLKPMGVPNQLPNAPVTVQHPEFEKEMKRKALRNIATGKKGF